MEYAAQSLTGKEVERGLDNGGTALVKFQKEACTGSMQEG